jgi:hypothetical protein
MLKGIERARVESAAWWSSWDEDFGQDGWTFMVRRGDPTAREYAEEIRMFALGPWHHRVSEHALAWSQCPDQSFRDGPRFLVAKETKSLARAMLSKIGRKPL